ncbi:mitochondrial carrier [Phaffia rhodozyma]|uniref:Mitochondrial carrier n=1 Tax=Phaffia rhodozyma TaxID=264483 RepID=A0A0F7SEG4_PHARH|nr:mitochondrial carrier [Phaffia rhodozyma]
MEFETETYLHVVYTSAQAVLATTLVLLIGYIIAGTRVYGPDTALGLRRISNTLLLPALVISIVGSTTSIQSIKSYWPIIAWTLFAHASSLLVAYVVFYWLFGLPGWIVEALSINNLTAFPLLVLSGMSLSAGLMAHIKNDNLPEVDRIDASVSQLARGLNYILVNAFVSEIARTIIVRFLLPKSIPAIKLPLDEEEDVSITPNSEHSTITPSASNPTAPVSDNEQTPLLASFESPPNYSATPNIAPSDNRPEGIYSKVNPLVLSGIVALMLAFIPKVQSAVFGSIGDGGLIGGTVGSTLGFLGSSFAVLELLGAGGGLRFGESLTKDEKPLGAVLSISFWRFAVLPALSITFAYLLKHHTAVSIQDPILYVVLTLTTLTPALLPISRSITSYQTQAYLRSYFVLPFITSFALAASVAVSGRGVSFESRVDWGSTSKKALGGGIAGAAAMIVQVLTLMPLRTVMNYQYRFGGSIKQAWNNLFGDGGFPRLYAGLPAALFQGPLSRFGDTAANAGILALLESVDLPVLVKTIGASAASATFRMTLTPIDALKTTQQTQGGVAGLRLLKERIKEFGVSSLWWGALATAAATFVGHYPWFATYNWLSEVIPHSHSLISKLARQALIGFSASVVSDTSSNSLRVLKTYRQVHEGDIGYIAAAKSIVATEGLTGLFGRGLRTRILTNGLQGLLFSVLWKLFADLIAGKGDE